MRDHTNKFWCRVPSQLRPLRIWLYEKLHMALGLLHPLCDLDLQGATQWEKQSSSFLGTCFMVGIATAPESTAASGQTAAPQLLPHSSGGTWVCRWNHLCLCSQIKFLAKSLSFYLPINTRSQILGWRLASSERPRNNQLTFSQRPSR